VILLIFDKPLESKNMVVVKSLLIALERILKIDVATPLLEECEDDTHIPEMGLGSPSGLPKLQSSIARVKTPRLESFFMSLESY
jgi:hypothetical protein